MNEFKDHTFVICAYKESEFLEKLIQSLKAQTVKSKMLIATSTPNDFISSLAKKYDIDLIVNDEGSKGIGHDWNFAVASAKTKFVTVAHQDDLYAPNYTEEMFKAINKNDDIIMLFTNHKEIRNNKIVKKNINLKIKQLMVLPIRLNKSSRFTKKLTLSFGNPVSCPSVCLNIEKVGKNPFKEDMNSNIDWGTWFSFVKLKGKFVYINKILFFHRVHRNSETSNCINTNIRIQEDFEMFCRIWPKWFAKILIVFYKYSEKANTVV